MTKRYTIHYIFFISVLLFTAGCGNNNAELEELKAKNKQLQASGKAVLSKLENLQLDYENQKVRYNELEEWSTALARQYGNSIWFFSEYDKPLPQESVREATPQILIDKLNKLFAKAGDPAVSIESITDNAIHVSISDEDKLTQNMGSSGAAGYISSVVYTLTSLKTIKCVHFDFKNDGHAFPGKHCR